MTSLQKNVFNAVLFNVVWLACVLGGNLVAIVVASTSIAFHLAVISRDIRELYLITAVALLGVVVDSALISMEVLQSPDGTVLPPVWLMSLWAVFATTLNHSLRWFQQNVVPAFIAGGIAGPLSYVTGTRLTNYQIGEPWSESLLALSLTWAVVFLVCILAARHLATRQMASLFPDQH